MKNLAKNILRILEDANKLIKNEAKTSEFKRITGKVYIFSRDNLLTIYICLVTFNDYEFIITSSKDRIYVAVTQPDN